MEIKLRAWLPAVKKMTYGHTIEEIMSWGLELEKSNKRQWMLCSTIHDSYGTEVWEGDILAVEVPFLRFPNGTIGKGKTETMHFEVYFEHGMFRVKEIGNPENNAPLYWTNHPFRVIGNKYEHPHLLKEAE